MIFTIFVLKQAKMKYVLILLTGLLLVRCGVKEPYSTQLKNDYNLDEESLKKVQFYTSSTIILKRSQSNGNKEITADGKLVMNENKNEDRLIIYPSTKCVFEKFGDKGEVYIRFEVGQGKTLRFAMRQNQSGGRYYLDAVFKSNVGGEVVYGNETYVMDSKSGNAFLLVAVKKLKKTRRKDRVVKGIKV